VIPVSRVKHYVPTAERQGALEIGIYQGEARMVRDNIRLGELRVPLPPGSREENGVAVRFTYDVNGLLQVEATVERTGEVSALVIEGNPGLLSEAEIRERFAALSELKIHPRDRLENRTLLARGERLYQQLRGAARESMGHEILRFEQALDAQDARLIAPAAEAFRALLDQVERLSHLMRDD
jgi:molecular chaperone HscC